MVAMPTVSRSDRIYVDMLSSAPGGEGGNRAAGDECVNGETLDAET